MRNLQRRDEIHPGAPRVSGWSDPGNTTGWAEVE